MEALKELVQEWEKEAQRQQDIAKLGESPTEAGEANAAADVYWKCARQLAQALQRTDGDGPNWDDPKHSQVGHRARMFKGDV